MVCLLIGATGIVNATGPKCQMSGWNKLPVGTYFSLGQNLNTIVTSDPLVGTALLNATAPWNASGIHSAGRIAGGSGTVYASDCPESNNYKIGAWSFINGYGGPKVCSSEPDVPVGTMVAAYTLGSTRSIGINTSIAWSVNGTPLANQADLQSTVTHEFGHALSLDHEAGGVCGQTGSSTCATQGDAKETMSYGPTGETCRRTLSPNDIDSVNQIY